MRLRLIFLLLASTLSWGQGSIVSGPPIAISQSGQILQNALVAVCRTYPGTTPIPPCGEVGNSLVNLFTDITLSVICSGSAGSPLNNSGNPTVGAGCSNPGTPINGNVVAYMPGGPNWCEYYGSGLPTQVFPCPAMGQSVNLSDISTGTSVAGFGDSTALCFNVTPASGQPGSPCALDQLAISKGWSFTNYGVSSTGCNDPGQFGQIVQLVIPAGVGTTYTYHSVNDMRNNLTATQQATWQYCLGAALWWLGTPETNKIRSSSAAVTYTGPWTNPPANYSGNIKSTTSPGAQATFQVYGSDIVVIPAWQLGNTSTYTITVDTINTYPTSGAYATNAGAYASIAFNTNYGPGFFHLTGFTNLIEGLHTVVYTCISADASDPCYFIAGGTSFGAGGSNSSFVYYDEPIQLETCGAGCGYNVITTPNCPVAPCGSPQLVGAFATEGGQVVDDLRSVGLNVRFVPTNAFYSPTGANVQADGVHPTGPGYALIKNANASAIKEFLNPDSRIGGGKSFCFSPHACITGGFGVPPSTSCVAFSTGSIYFRFDAVSASTVQYVCQGSTWTPITVP